MQPRAIKSLLLVTLILLTCATIALAAAPTTSPSTQPAAGAVSPTLPPGSLEREPIRRTADGNGTAKASNRSNDPNGTADAVRATTRSLDPQRLLLSLGVVIGVIVLARYGIKKLFPAASVGRSSQVIKVLSRSVLAPKQQFLLLQVGKRLIVVGDTGASMNALAVINDPDEVASLVGQLASEQPTSSVATFASMFRKAGNEFSSPALVPPVKDDEDDADDAAVGEESIEHREIEHREMPDPALSVASQDVSNLLGRVRGLAQHLRKS